MTNAIPSPSAVAKVSSTKRPPVTAELRHRRGEVWMVLADPTAPATGNELWSNRPAVIVSNNVINARSGIAQVVYLTTATRKRTGPTHVEVDAPNGQGTAMILCEQVHTVDASRLRRKMADLPAESIRELDSALALSLGIGRNPNTHTLFSKWEEHIKVNGIDLAAEIRALSGHTTDQRVDALERALRLVAIERDSYRNLFEASPARADVLQEVAAALGNRENA